MRRIGLIFGLLGVLATGPMARAEQVHVLVANDDGVDAPGLRALVEVLASDPAYRVTVVAPASQQSSKAHSLVTDGTVRVTRRPPIAGAPAFAVEATPASTVRLALTGLLVDDPPDLVLSGINRGENDGLLAWSSGTVAAAREAAFDDLPAIAFSLELDWGDPSPDFAEAARWAKPIVDHACRFGLPAGVLLNVNIPRVPSRIEGYRLVRCSLATATVSAFVRVGDEGGALLFSPRWAPAEDHSLETDTGALAAGWVTIVPLGLDQTAFKAFPVVGWAGRLSAPPALADPPEGRPAAE